MLLVSIVPEEKIFYSVLAIELGSASMETEIGRKALEVLESELDEILKGNE